MSEKELARRMIPIQRGTLGWRDTLLEDLTSTEIKDLDVWYGKHEMQEEVYSVSYKITTDDKFLQNMMRSVDALPAKTEANLEPVNGRSAEFFKTSVLYARRKLIPRLSFETSVIYRELTEERYHLVPWMTVA